MTLQEAYEYGSTLLHSRNVADAELDAWYLLEYLTGKNRGYYLAHREEQLTPSQVIAYEELLENRGRHIPLQHLTGRQEFMGLSFRVNEDVLIPRQDTETLAEEALKLLEPGMRVLDVCTGSGCILISLLACCPGLWGLGTDLSAEALAVARENAAEHQIEAEFRKSDLFERIPEADFDCIVSNPPYIATGEIPKLMEEVRDHEPHLALDGGEDGLCFYRALAREAKEHLKEGGHLLLEIGYDQGEAVSRMLSQSGFREVRVIRDLCRKDRVVCGTKGKE